MDVTILIPAYEPDDLLIGTVTDLSQAGYQRFVIVNDGSKSECEPIFEQLSQRTDTTILTHSVNMGKGRAMKYGFNYILNHWPESAVVACDSDGQHPVQAVKDVENALQQHPECMVLGYRKFNQVEHIPLPNYLGNNITRGLFYLLTGIWFADTQCGLRGFPPSVIKAILPMAESVTLLKCVD